MGLNIFVLNGSVEFEVPDSKMPKIVKALKPFKTKGRL